MPADNHLKTIDAMLISLILITLLMSCKECPTEPEPDYNIYLAVEDVFCTSVTLKVTLPDSGKVNRFALERNDSVIVTMTCYDDDTLITDENLKPNTDYTYRVRFLKDGKTKAESESITIHTMPTTSHNFIWEIDTLGLYSSYLNDVWIVDENNIWVVGYIRVPDPDSSFDGTGRETFNAARWDGEKWNLMRIVNPDPLYSIFYFDENNIWVSNGLPIHWDGNNWILYHIQRMGISAIVEHGIWGTSSSNIYFVGSYGSIVHYDGSQFRKMESGIDFSFCDIIGNQDRVWAVAYTNSPEIKNKVLEYKNGVWSVKFDRDLINNWPPEDYTIPSGSFSSVWCCGKTLYVGCASVWRESISTGQGRLVPLEEMGWKLGWGTEFVRGNNHNDIFVIKEFGSDLTHFNGQTWRYDESLKAMDPHGLVVHYGMAVKDDLVVIVGFDITTNRATVYRGYR